jgi:hypothetical protein
MKKKIHQIINSPGFNIGIGIFLTCYSLYDMEEDIVKMNHRHLNVLMGILMILNACRHLFEGTHKILGRVENESVQFFYKQGDRFIDRPIIGIIIGLIIIITSTYGIYEDIENLKSHSIPIAIAIVLIIIAITSIYGGGKKIIKKVDEVS